LRMFKDMGEGGVKKLGKSGDVLYGRHPTQFIQGTKMRVSRGIGVPLPPFLLFM
jgi:hypothetical protein